MTAPSPTPLLDLTPAPGAAPAGRRVLSHALTEVRLLVRNGEQLLLALVIPLAIIVLAAATGGRFVPLSSAAPSVLGLSVWSSAFTSVAIATGFERRYGVLKRLGATPLPRLGLLAAKVLALLVVEVFQILVLSLVALVLGWSPSAGVVGAVGFVLAWLLGTAAFVSLGLLLAGTLRAEATLAAANLIYLLLLAGGAVVLPSTSYGAFGSFAQWLPSGALGDAMRAAFIDGRKMLICWSEGSRKAFRPS